MEHSPEPTEGTDNPLSASRIPPTELLPDSVDLPTALVPPSYPTDAAAHPMDGVPPWARLLLYRVWRGVPLNDARTMDGSKVSEYMVRTLGIQRPNWRLALDDAQRGALLDCPVLPDDVTRAWALDEEQRRHDLAMSASEKYAAPYLKMGMDAIGRGPRGADATGTPSAQQTIVQLQVYLGTLPPQQQQQAADAIEARLSQRPGR